MENELLLETFAYGIGHGITYLMYIGILISLFDLIHETALEKQWKRNSLIGKLSSREYSLLDEKINECIADFNNDNLNELGALLVCFVDANRIEYRKRKKFFDKLKFWKRKKNIKRIPPGYITFSEQFISSDFFKGEDVEKEFNAFIKSLGMTKKDIKNMK